MGDEQLGHVGWSPDFKTEPDTKIEHVIQQLRAKPDSSAKSEHQQRVEKFMEGAGQKVRHKPEIPTAEERILRARLILEEALETVYALGIGVQANVEENDPILGIGDLTLWDGCGEPDLAEIADGCADIAVVTTGTLSSCGIADKSLQEEVDNNNLEKLAKGHRDEHGKLVKPEGHEPPDIRRILREQGWKDAPDEDQRS